MKLPQDPFMLLSAVNTQLRDNYKSLDSFCAAACCGRQELESKLAAIGYKYNAEVNQFV